MHATIGMTSAGEGYARRSNLSRHQSAIGGSNLSSNSAQIEEDSYPKKAEGTPSQFMPLKTRQKLIRGATNHDSTNLDKMTLRKMSSRKITQKVDMENTDDVAGILKKKKRFSSLYDRGPALRRMQTVFEGANCPLEDALEDAKSTKWRVSQMVLLSKISLVITIFSFLCSTVSHSLEYHERFTLQLDGLLYIQMTAAIITSIIRLLFYTISKLHLVAKKDILPSTPIWHIWPPTKIISELTLLLMHPSPFLVGIQCHLYNTEVPGWYFYH
jgi:hypothetical protein